MCGNTCVFFSDPTKLLKANHEYPSLRSTKTTYSEKLFSTNPTNFKFILPNAVNSSL